MTLKQYIEQTNQEFNDAPIEAKRVMIAKDVIKRLQMGNIIAAGGDIIHLESVEFKTGSESFQAIINEKDGCQVCGKGALLCSYIGRVNKFTVDDTQKWNSYWDDEQDVETRGKDLVHHKLQELFPIEQLDLIETAFEGHSFLGVANDGDVEKAINNYYNECKNEDGFILRENDLLKSIMENIISNNGTFIP